MCYDYDLTVGVIETPFHVYYYFIKYFIIQRHVSFFGFFILIYNYLFVIKSDDPRRISEDNIVYLEMRAQSSQSRTSQLTTHNLSYHESRITNITFFLLFVRSQITTG